jgi:CelD/BcsL family acetyltransferase involved in cellulose biosynthesis
VKWLRSSTLAMATLAESLLGSKPVWAMPPASVRGSFQLQASSNPNDLLAVANEWDRLALTVGSPFCTVEWLTAWWGAFGKGTFTCLLLRDNDGTLRAGACCQRLSGGRLRAAANVYTEDWDVVAANEEARAELWRGLAGLGARYVQFVALRDPRNVDVACSALRDAGYSVVKSTATQCPYLELPGTWEQLLSSVSGKLQKRLRYYRRLLEREGVARFRTTSGEEQLDRDLDAFLRVEGSGWKARSGTAILSDSRTERLYRDFAREAAKNGWLRLHLLELDGIPIAGDLGCAFAGGSLLIKTGFDERYARLSPGLVLRADALRASIEEGSRFYDFLGGPDDWKLRWTTEVRPRMVVSAYRGAWRLLSLYQAAVAPLRTIRVLRGAVIRLRAIKAHALRAIRAHTF